MTEVISIKFRGKGKAYFFDPAGVTAKPGDKLVVETSKGMELGDCTCGNHMVEDTVVVPPLRPVVRMATADDLRVAEINLAREKEAFDICLEKIQKHGLEMKLVDVECSFEGNKILFFFTADGRVDFRELVKDLASVFRTRIELRQIGVRDEAKMLGGLGICGRPFCCNMFLDDFQPVSTKMAKTQSMSLNPVKISGTCGRLMCCLRYEQDAYEDLVKHVPKNGAFVQTVDGYGTVVLVNLLRQSVKVKLDGTGDPVFHNYSVEEIAEVPGGRPAEGEPLPQVLQYKPRPKPEKTEEPCWAMPQMLPEETAEETEAAPAGGEQPAVRKSNQHRRRHSKGGPTSGAPRTEKTERTEKSEKPRSAESGKNAHRGKPHPQNGQTERPPRPAGEEKSAPARKNGSHHHRGHGHSRGDGESKTPKSE